MVLYLDDINQIKSIRVKTAMREYFFDGVKEAQAKGYIKMTEGEHWDSLGRPYGVKIELNSTNAEVFLNNNQ